MIRKTAFLLTLSALVAACAQPVPTQAPSEPVPSESKTGAQETAGSQVTLIIESWRNDDLPIWQDVIIPAFEKKYPNIKVIFSPTAPADYNGVLNSKLEAGTAGDLITCRPFDVSLKLFEKGYLAPLNDLPGMENFSDFAKTAWSTDDLKTTFCVPMASVIHGFFYNKEAFDKLGLKEPETWEEFYQMLDKIKADGTYVPLVMGTADMWEAATMGFQNIGPNYWKGEEGRLALIQGKAKFTDEPYIKTWQQLAKWRDYLPPGFESIKYPDAQTFFTIGRGAIYPTGSWEIALFEKQATFPLGIFKPPVEKAGDECYISDHVDIALGMNAATKHPQEARTFLSWVASAEFAELYGNALPGFFPLHNTPVELKNELAKEFVSWRSECKSTIRNSYHILSRGEPNLENELWRVSAAVINGTLTPEQAAKEIQEGLDRWYKPTQQ